MQQLTYVKKRVLEWREAPEPTLRSPQEAIVRPFVAARCDSDIVPLFHNPTTPMKLGLILHYELTSKCTNSDDTLLAFC